VECQEDKIEIGGLTGNQFGLILRLLRAEDGEEAVRRVEGLTARGMINYFGLQRFGQFSVKTYELGILCVRKEWQQLVESVILSDCNNFEANNLKR
jgi:tRNA pseudouridine13 synthase